MAQSYQNFEGNPEAAAPAGSYDDRLPTQYGREEAYQAQAPQGGAPDAEDGFHPTTVRSILRYVEIVLALITFAVVGSIKHVDKVPFVQYQVVYGAFAFLYALFIIFADVARLKSRYFPNLPLGEFALDFLFANVMFFGSLAMGANCNRKISGMDFHFCDGSSFGDTSGSSTPLKKSRASAGFGILTGLVFAVSAVIAFRRVRKTG